jgi:hypothetical protein
MKFSKKNRSRSHQLPLFFLHSWLLYLVTKLQCRSAQSLIWKCIARMIAS